ncbi:MAG: tetratricopeptide repeat protein [Desulfobacterales bacterium]|nr:tetratricopeptide repeat protein [Desulfobacterales bacterium]
MSEKEQIEMLKNAVREPVSALTAVEVDSQYRASEISRILQQEIRERPFHTIIFSASESAGILMENARQAISQWALQQGVLFVTDSGGSDEKTSHRFWVEMNFLRESWGALDCHVVFFLLPGSFLMMLRAADHLADWIPLKLHIIGVSDDLGIHQSTDSETRVFSESKMSPKTARQVLSTLEPQLAEAINKGLDKSLLVRRYYLPMFEAATALTDLQRAQSLREKISETDIPESDLPEWWNMNCWLDIDLRNLNHAQKWAEKLHDWSDKNRDDKWKSQSYHALGRIAQERRDFEKAEIWYRKSLEIKEKQGNEHGAASTYHQLGMIAQKRRDFENAEIWYRKSLEIKEKQGNEHGAASTYHQLGMIAEERRDFENAEIWYRKSLEIKEKQGNEHGAASTYHQLGIIAEERRDFENAEIWYRKSLEIEEKQGNEHGAAITYHQIGRIAEERRDFENAEIWYRKSLEISEKQGDEHGAALTYHQLGSLSGLQTNYEKAGQWLIKSVTAFLKWNDPENTQKGKNNFLIFYEQADSSVQAKLKAMWEDAGLEELSEL